MSAAEELAFDPESYQANLYKVTLYDGRPAPQYGDMFLTEAEEVHFLPVSQPLSGILQLKDQDPQRRAAIHHREVLERSLRSFAARWIPDVSSAIEASDEAHWKGHCIPFISTWLSHPLLSPLVSEAAAAAGHGNPAIAALDMARRICERAWRARRSQRARYLQMLRNLESEDYD
eukprot:4447700-Pyramimonas_sp.AAC.1